MMKEISKKAKLSKEYTNHQIRKTTVKAMPHSGFGLNQIFHIMKHKNLNSLKHYLDAPTHSEKQGYNSALYDYARNAPAAPKRKILPIGDTEQVTKSPKVADEAERSLVSYTENSNSNEALPAVPVTQNVVTNQLHQVSNLFQNASFSNCSFTFTLPK